MACKYLQSQQEFQQNLQTAGFADHPGIQAMGIMQADMPVERFLAMAQFAQALRRKQAARDKFDKRT